MTLALSVPNLSERQPEDMELQPSKVKKWLDELPLLNMAETSLKLFTTLSLHNRTAFDDHNRMQLLELFRGPVIQTTRELSKQFIALPLPLSEKHKTIAEQNRQFHLEMANGYKRIVLNSANVSGNRKEQAMLALALQRALRHLTGALVASYEAYAPSPHEAWKEIHALYLYAEEHGLLQNEVDDPLNKSVEKSSILHAYLQALLLDFSDPYHLPPRMIGQIHHYLDRWATLATLTEYTSNRKPTCQFLIDQTRDRAGIGYTTNTETEPAGKYRLLDTTGLVRQIHAQLKQILAGEIPPADGLYENFFHECGQDLLRRLVSAWGINPQRGFRRNQRNDLRMDIAVGLDAVNYWINGGKKFVVSSSFVGPMPLRTQISMEERKPTTTYLPEREYSTWDVEDESAGGLSLSKTDPIRPPVQVGDLVISRRPGEGGAWSVGIIRWVKGVTSAKLEIGVQHLAPNAEPVVIKTLSEKNVESDFLPALLLPEIKPLKQPQTLITHRGVCKRGIAVFMDNGYHLYRIMPTRLLASSHAFEQFQFDILNN
jgi:hypothetical protein